MAFRVDDIIVSDKNVFLLSGGHQFIADIEKKNEIKQSSKSSRDINPWNIYTEDGHIVHNVFDMEKFHIRTQVITGSNYASPHMKDSHESYFMPNPVTYVGTCQFYNNAYSISENTTSKFNTQYKTVTNQKEVYEAEESFIRYEKISTYENMIDYYITPNIAFTPTNGIQYITEYPVTDFYSDFGDNEDNENPTVYGDSVPAKYYLNEEYSVSSYDSSDVKSRFNYLRTYYGIGNTGNTVYLVYRNNLNGTSNIISNDGVYVDTHKVDNVEYEIISPLYRVSMMSNITTMSDVKDGIMYSSTPNTDFFEFTALEDVENASFIKQPKDNSFILFFRCNGNASTDIVYIPRTGLDKSIYKLNITEKINESNIIMLEHSIVIGSNKNGILNVWSKNYLYDGGKSIVDFYPFQYAKIGKPSSGEELVTVDGESKYSDIQLYYNGSDILGARAKYSYSDEEYYFIALLSTTFTDGDDEYEIGQYFMPAGHPNYEIVPYTITEYTTTQEISSVPSSYSVTTETGDTQTLWTYVLSSVDVKHVAGEKEYNDFDAKANVIQDNSYVMFDYSSTEVEKELEIGSYAFVQFHNYGLGKCYIKDIYNDDKFAKLTPTGPKNRSDVTDGYTCYDVRFCVNSYNENTKKSAFDVVDFIGSTSNDSYVYGKPALKASYYTQNSSNKKYAESYSLLPLTDREAIIEPSFTSTIASKDVEYFAISDTKYALNIPIENSYAITVKSIKPNNIKHDASVALVRWNSNNVYSSQKVYNNSNDFSLDGLHLQYSGICSEVYVAGTNTMVNDGDNNWRSNYSSTIYEYPHPCYGEFRTAGTGLKIFDGELDGSMTSNDIMFVNDYLVVKNYHVKNMTNNSTSVADEKILESGKYYKHDTGTFLSGGYVVSNFYKDAKNSLPSLYDSELKFSSKNDLNTSSLSEKIYDFNYLWHIKPSKAIEFYPMSYSKKEWKPYYVSKYVDFIKYHNGYYYIALSSSKTKDANTVGYEIIETTDLFTEEKTVSLGTGKYVSGIKFFDDYVAIEYTDLTNTDVNLQKKTVWFKYGNASSKIISMKFCNTSEFEDGATSSINRATLELSKDLSEDVRATYDNVEIIHSFNRFTSVVNHKSNLFSLKISDLGLDESSYLTEKQKQNLRIWFKNRITTMVDAVKPAHTQLFDVYID